MDIAQAIRSGGIRRVREVDGRIRLLTDSRRVVTWANQQLSEGRMLILVEYYAITGRFMRRGSTSSRVLCSLLAPVGESDWLWSRVRRTVGRAAMNGTTSGQRRWFLNDMTMYSPAAWHPEFWYSDIRHRLETGWAVDPARVSDDPMYVYLINTGAVMYRDIPKNYQWGGGLQQANQKLKTATSRLEAAKSSMQLYQRQVRQNEAALKQAKKEVEALKKDSKREPIEETLKRVLALPGVQDLTYNRSDGRLVVYFHPTICRASKGAEHRSRGSNMDVLVPRSYISLGKAIGGVDVFFGADEQNHPHNHCTGDYGIALHHSYEKGDLVGAVTCGLLWRKTHGAGSYARDVQQVARTTIGMLKRGTWRGPRVYEDRGELIPIPDVFINTLRPIYFPNLRVWVVGHANHMEFYTGGNRAWNPDLPRPMDVAPHSVSSGSNRMSMGYIRPRTRLLPFDLNRAGSILQMGGHPANEDAGWNRVNRIQAERNAQLSNWGLARATDPDHHATLHQRLVNHDHASGAQNRVHTPEWNLLHQNPAVYAADPEAQWSTDPPPSPRIPESRDYNEHAAFHDEGINHTHANGHTHLPGETYQHALWDWELAADGSPPPPPPPANDEVEEDVVYEVEVEADTLFPSDESSMVASVTIENIRRR